MSQQTEINAQSMHSHPHPDKKAKVSRSRTDMRYWLPKVHKVQSASGVLSPDYSVQIAHNGRRVRFPLKTPNKETAALKAQEIYLSLRSNGWEATLAKEKPTKGQTTKPATIGNAIEAACRISSARAVSLTTYSKALRRIASEILKIDGGRKFDAFKGGREAWKKKIDQINLAELTPEKVLAWKNETLKSAKSPEKRQRAAVTLNSLIRNAKALFSKRIIAFLRTEIDLPSPLFFEGVGTEKQGSLRYKSAIDAEAILQTANAELREPNPEAFKALILFLVLGLRRSEADWLCWDQFDFQKNTLTMRDTEFKQLKSADSGGDIDLEEEISSVFQTLRLNASGAFVLETPSRVRNSTPNVRKARCYRCNATFHDLIKWLRIQGVKDAKPIHTLRKEIGSIVASKQGIWQASRYLRHSDIRITSAIYADKKLPVTSGLGKMLG